MESFAARLKLLMESRKINASKLAELLGYTSSEKISRLLRKDDALPSFDIIADIANLFENLNVRWLVSGAGSPYVDTPQTELANKYLLELDQSLSKITELESSLEVHSAKLYALEEFVLKLAMELRESDRRTQSVILGKLEGVGYRLGADTYSAVAESEGTKYKKKKRST